MNDSIIGKRVGDYTIVGRLGEGGMGVVFRATKRDFEKEYAIKFISLERLGWTQAEKKKLEDRFSREIRKLIALDHPNIVGIIDAGVYKDSPYMVMPHITGGSLKGYLKEHTRLTWQQAMHLLIPAANALEYAHQLGVIHRDIKPANILLTSSIAPMIVDFGIAKATGFAAETTLTAEGALLGTPAYMAPEQLDHRATAQVDIYALGTVLYELITGKLPYPISDNANPIGFLVRKHTTLPIAPSAFSANLPPEVEKVILKAMAPEPEQRYATMREFALAMGQVLYTLGGDVDAITLPPISMPTVLDLKPGPVTTRQRTAPTASPRRTASGGRPMTRVLAWGGVAIFLVVLLGALAGGGVLLSRSVIFAPDPTSTITSTSTVAVAQPTSLRTPTHTPAVTATNVVIVITATLNPAQLATEPESPTATHTPTPTRTAAAAQATPVRTLAPTSTLPPVPTAANVCVNHGGVANVSNACTCQGTTLEITFCNSDGVKFERNTGATCQIPASCGGGGNPAPTPGDSGGGGPAPTSAPPTLAPP